MKSAGKTKLTSPNLGPTGKKLKQARLPFTSLSTSPVIKQLDGEPRKRKLSNSEGDQRSAKVNRKTEIQDEIPVPIVQSENIIEISDNENSSSAITSKDIVSCSVVIEIMDSNKFSLKKAINSDENKLLTENMANITEKSSPVVSEIKTPKTKSTNKIKPSNSTTPKSSKSTTPKFSKSTTSKSSKSATPKSSKSTTPKSSRKTKHICIDIDDEKTEEDSKIVIKLPINKKRKLSAKAVKNDKKKHDADCKETFVKDDEADGIHKSTTDIIPTIVVESDDDNLTEKPLQNSPENDVNLQQESNDSESVEKPDDTNHEKDDSETIDSIKTKDDDNNKVDKDKLSLEDEEAEGISTKDEEVSLSQCDTSLSSNPITPIRNKNSEEKKLTPKQTQKQLESAKKLLEKQKAKDEREKKLQEIKEQKQKLVREKEYQKKKEREDKEEQRRKERDEKEEQKRKEKEERDKKKQAEIDLKNEEKRLKEEERKKKEEQKEEDRRKKDEEKNALEEAKTKKKLKEMQAITKFFVPRKSNVKKAEQDNGEVSESNQQNNFMPFRIKEDMKLAPTVRRTLSDERRSILEEKVLSNINTNISKDDLYLERLRTKRCVPQKDGKTFKIEDTENDVIIIDELEGAATVIEEHTIKQDYRAKFFKFEENRRPAFHGTWRKSSLKIKPRKPFATDTIHFDYDVDSDDEWEEEEPGESLHGSDDEKESADEYDIDNEFFVPHGHLSDEELLKEDEIDDDNSPDAQKAKLKIIQREFADEMKKKTEKIKPRLIGVIWQNKDGSQPSNCPNVIWSILIARAMIFQSPSVVMNKTATVNSIVDSVSNEIDNKTNSNVNKRVKITEDFVAELIQLIHGNTNNKVFIAREFQAYLAKKHEEIENFPKFSELSIINKIKNLAKWRACPDDGMFHKKYCWYVASEKREFYKVTDITLPNNWSYILKPKRITEVKEKEKSTLVVEQPVETTSKTLKPAANAGIAKFTTVLTDDDKKKQFNSVIQDVNKVSKLNEDLNSTATKKPSTTPVVKKRVNLLMSVPRGQAIPANAKNALISQFLSKSKTNSQTEPDGAKIDKDDVIVLDS